MITVRLVLGDQLNPNHCWFQGIDDAVVYVFMEVRQETDYVLHHAQKVIAIFAGMRDLAMTLQAAGHRVHYLKISDPDNTQSFVGNLDWLIKHYNAHCFQYQMPDEWRLDQQLNDYATALRQRGILTDAVDSAHFLASRDHAKTLFASQKNWVMERFYRDMRSRHGVLLTTEGKPVGGQWNFDHENRGRWNGQQSLPPDSRHRHDHQSLWEEIQSAGIHTFGEARADDIRWPLNRADALAQLSDFITHRLPYFGQFQDAMTRQDWRLFHALLSFALNTKMLNPKEVILAAEQAYIKGQVPIAAAEGFIRQILGWREYVRCVYWARMPDYVHHNHFQHEQDLPAWFWTGKTHMRCLSMAIGQSLEQAYAHHIQRLMVIGNFALLAGLNPQQLHTWYLGIYIDAFEWVELPNTLGMSQYADGGLLATKPYVSSAAYIDKMSDYCKDCRYDKKQRTGPKACPFNALYWDFHARHAETLSKNPRIGMVYRQLEKMSPEVKTAMTEQAAHWRSRLDTL
jgi:deoxyribodipyrimidine photolyase-related protein